MHDEGASCNCGQQRRRKIHIVVAVLESVRHFPESTNLLIAVLMPLAHLLPFRLCPVVSLPHDRTCLVWEVRCRAHQHHPLDARRLLSRHMQQGLCSETHSNRLELSDAQMIQHCEDIESRLPERELLRRVGRSTVPSKVGHEQPVSGRSIREYEIPVHARAGTSM